MQTHMNDKLAELHAEKDHGDDDGSDPAFIGWLYPSGLMTITVEGMDAEVVDGETLLSFHKYSGVECGPSQVFAAAGVPAPLLFVGDFEEHRAIFKQWEAHAWENDRPNVFVDEGIAGLLALGHATRPPMPEIDAAASERFSHVVRAARKQARAEYGLADDE
jgi:hypothetical protein